MSCCVVATTIDSADGAEQLSRSAVEARLAACGQVSGPITSTYWWDGAPVGAQEWTIVFKTTDAVVESLIDHLLADSFIPVIATVGMDKNGVPYNINADTAAAEIAIALHAEKLVSMTDIVGLLYDKNDESTLIPEVEVSEIEGYKAAGVIAGGMLPKIEGMADAIYQGVHEAVIIDGRVPHSILLEMFSDRGAGTMFYRRGNR